MALFRKKLREVDATQAQIEAADQLMLPQVRAQLEGLAIGLEQRDEKSAAHIIRRYLALTAAQVGAFEAGPDECDTGVALTKAIDAVLAEDTPLVNHTIERCAQVADSFHAYDRPADEIAAAIRKLKETA
jgi:hypothetical protein